MPNEVTFRKGQGIVEVQSHGAVSRGDLERGREAVRALCIKHGVSKVLVDTTGAEQLPSSMELFDFAASFQNALPSPTRVAVAIGTRFRSDLRFVETVAFNRGAHLRLFDSTPEALGWLEATCGPSVPRAERDGGGDMEAIMWTRELSVGDARLDEHHKRFIQIINRLARETNASPRSETVSDLLNDMTSYAREHFTVEEDLMARYRYPRREKHIRLHRAFRRKTAGFCSATALGADVVPQMPEYLMDWLAHHIMECDKAYSSFFREHEVC